MIAHSIKGCRPLGQTCGVLIHSPCINTTLEPKITNAAIGGPVYVTELVYIKPLLRTDNGGSHILETAKPSTQIKT